MVKRGKYTRKPATENHMTTETRTRDLEKGSSDSREAKMMLLMKPDSPSVDGMLSVASYQEGEVIGYIKKSKMPRDHSIPAMMVVALDADSGHPIIKRSWLPNADEKSARKWLCSKIGPEDAR